MNSSTPPQLRFQQAVAAIGRHDLATAQALLTDLLREAPEHPDILQLLGVVHSRSGRLAEAVVCFEASLSKVERQPHVHNNLAGVLIATGKPDAAERHFRRALALKPDYADAKYNLALALRAQRPAEARLLLDEVIRALPQNGNAYDALGLVLGDLGDKEGAFAAASKACALTPNSHTAHHNLGQAALALRDFTKAEDAYRVALRLRPNSDASWMGLGNTLRSLDRNEEAMQAFERATLANPANPHAHRLLNELLWQTGKTEKYLRSYPHALAARPTDAVLRLAYAEELLRIRQPAEAAKELALAATAAPNDPYIEDALARTAAIQGDYERAAAHHGRATSAAPEITRFANNFVETLLKAERHADALDVSTTALKVEPLDQRALALHTTALQVLGDARHKRLADFASIAKVLRVEPPAGFADEGTFNAALAAELRKFHATKNHPTDQTLQGGTQTFGALFEKESPLIAQLRRQIEHAVARFIAEMPDDPSHPFFGRKRQSFGFSGSWSVCLHEGGFHTNHIHPMGWISSAYYVAVPEETETAPQNPGWFKLGETNLQLGRHDKIQRLVQPKIGHLVLFPSYFWHGTVPFQSASERMTVAFDVVPK